MLQHIPSHYALGFCPPPLSTGKKKKILKVECSILRASELPPIKKLASYIYNNFKNTNYI